MDSYDGTGTPGTQKFIQKWSKNADQQEKTFENQIEKLLAAAGGDGGLVLDPRGKWRARQQLALGPTGGFLHNLRRETGQQVEETVAVRRLASQLLDASHGNLSGQLRLRAIKSLAKSYNCEKGTTYAEGHFGQIQQRRENRLDSKRMTSGCRCTKTDDRRYETLEEFRLVELGRAGFASVQQLTGPVKNEDLAGSAGVTSN